MTTHVNNYTKDHNFIWDELHLPITYDSDWRTAYDRFKEVLVAETQKITENAKAEIKGIKDKYYLESVGPIEPEIYVRLTDNWINFEMRFVSISGQRRMIKDKLSRKFLTIIEQSSNMKIATEGVIVTVDAE